MNGNLECSHDDMDDDMGQERIMNGLNRLQLKRQPPTMALSLSCGSSSIRADQYDGLRITPC